MGQKEHIYVERNPRLFYGNSEFEPYEEGGERACWGLKDQRKVSGNDTYIRIECASGANECHHLHKTPDTFQKDSLSFREREKGRIWGVHSPTGALRYVGGEEKGQREIGLE